MGYKSIIVRVGGKNPEFIDEIAPTMLNKALDEGYAIKEIYQIANRPSAGGAGGAVGGVVVLTYVLYKQD
jgi:hypothetical protein